MERSWKAKGSARMGKMGLVGWRGWALCSNEVLCNNGKPIHKKPERPGWGTLQLLNSERRVCQKPLKGIVGWKTTWLFCHVVPSFQHFLAHRFLEWMHYVHACDGVMLRSWRAGWQEDRGVKRAGGWYQRWLQQWRKKQVSAGLAERERRNSDCAGEKAHAVCTQCGPEDLCSPTHDITTMNTATLLQMVMYAFQQKSVCVRPVTLLKTHHRARTHNIAL